MDLALAKVRLEGEFDYLRADNKTLLAQALESIESLNARNAKITKERDRLEEVVLDLRGDIKILLSAGSNVADVKFLLRDLSKSMQKMEKSCEYNASSAEAIKHFLEFFDKFEPEEPAQPYMDSEAGKKTSTKRKRSFPKGPQVDVDVERHGYEDSRQYGHQEGPKYAVRYVSGPRQGTS